MLDTTPAQVKRLGMLSSGLLLRNTQKQNDSQNRK